MVEIRQPVRAGIRLDVGWTKDHIVAYEAIRSPLIREMRGYWMGLAAGGRIPRVADLDRAVLGDIARYMTISRILAPDGTVGYLRGAPACEALDGVFTGQHLDETNWSAVDRHIIRRQYRDLIACGEPLFAEDYYEHDDQQRSVFELAMFPMADATGALSECVIIRDYASRRPLLPSDAVERESDPFARVDLRHLLDDLSIDLFLIDAGRRIVWHNRPAARLIEEGFLTDPTRRLLSPADVHANARLRHLCANGWPDGGARLIPVERAGEPSQVYLLLRSAGPKPGDRELGGLYFAMVLDPRRQVAFPVPFQHMFNLTRAEGRLAAGLANGQTLQDYARMQDLSLNTARSVLKTVFRKVGVGRQADLVRIVLGLSGIDSEGLQR